MKKFEIGNTYIRPGLFIPSFWVRIVSRTETEITFEELDFPGTFNTYQISFDEAGNEIAQVWEYEDIVGYIRAGN